MQTEAARRQLLTSWTLRMRTTGVRRGSARDAANAGHAAGTSAANEQLVRRVRCKVERASDHGHSFRHELAARHSVRLYAERSRERSRLFRCDGRNDAAPPESLWIYVGGSAGEKQGVS